MLRDPGVARSLTLALHPWLPYSAPPALRQCCPHAARRSSHDGTRLRRSSHVATRFGGRHMSPRGFGGRHMGTRLGGRHMTARGCGGRHTSPRAYGGRHMSAAAAAVVTCRQRLRRSSHVATRQGRQIMRFSVRAEVVRTSGYTTVALSGLNYNAL